MRKYQYLEATAAGCQKHASGKHFFGESVVCFISCSLPRIKSKHKVLSAYSINYGETIRRAIAYLLRRKYIRYLTPAEVIINRLQGKLP